MENKFNLIKNAMMPGMKYNIRMFRLKLDEPQIGVNPRNNTPQSKTIMRIKQIFRNRFKDRIPNYQYDIMMHISDNYIQSKFCDTVLNMDKDVSDLPEMLSEFDYIVVKYKECRQSKSFPKTFVLLSDIDLLVNKVDMLNISEKAYGYLLQKFEHPWIRIKQRMLGNTFDIMVMINDFKLFSIHLCDIDYFNIDSQYALVCIENRIKDENNFYYNSDKYEMPFRLTEFMKAPNKIWHKKFISAHCDEVDESILHKAFAHNDELYKKARQLIDTLNNN